MTRHRLKLVGVGLVTSGVFMVLAVRNLEIADVRQAFGAVEFLPWVPLAVLCYLVGHAVRGLRCRVLVRSEVALGVVGATNVVVLGYAINNVLPARLGEVARATMLARLSGLSFARCVAITFVERVFDGLTLLGLLVLAAARFPEVSWVASAMRLGAVLFGVLVVGLTLVSLMPGYVANVASRVAARFGDRAHVKVVRWVSEVISGVAGLRERGTVLSLAALSIVIWLLEATMFLCLLPAFGVWPAVGLAVLTMSVTNFGILVPSTPGFVGAFHFFCMETLALAGVAEPLAFGYAVVAHLAFFVPITLWGAAILAGYGVRLGSMVAQVAEAYPIESRGQQLSRKCLPLRHKRRIDASLVAVTEALVPLERHGITGAERAKVLEDVAGFVAEELGDLPGHLTWLWEFGFLAFRGATVIVRFRDVRQMPLARRRRWVESWAYGRLWFARQLFRAVRSTALLAYYEHPLVKVRLELGPVRELRRSRVA